MIITIFQSLHVQLYLGLHGLRKAFVKPQFYLFRPLPGADEGGSEGSTCIASGRRPVLVRFWQGLGARDCGGYV